MIGIEQNNLLSTRSADIKRLFQDLSLSKSPTLTLSELSQYLSSRSGRNFSNDLLVEIFRALERDQNSQITFDEFVSGYAKAESLMQTKIEALKEQIVRSTQNLSESKRQLIEARARKADNVLTVKILGSSGLRPASVISGLKGPVVSILCEGQEAITRPANPKMIEWDEVFTFVISNSSGDILIQVHDSEKGKKGALIGKVAIPLEALSDQQLHAETLEVRNERDVGKVQGDLMIELQWIYDLPLFLEGIINDYNQAIGEDKEELNAMENYLQELQVPLLRNSVSASSTQFETKIVEKINELYQSTIAEKIQWKSFAEICIISFILISTVTMMCRSDFFNVRYMQVSVACAAAIHFYFPEYRSFGFKILFYATLGSQIYDVTWMCLYLNVMKM